MISSSALWQSPRDGVSIKTLVSGEPIPNPVVLKYRVGVRRGITNRLMARRGSLGLAVSPSSDGVTIKIPANGQLYHKEGRGSSPNSLETLASPIGQVKTSFGSSLKLVNCICLLREKNAVFMVWLCVLVESDHPVFRISLFFK